MNIQLHNATCDRCGSLDKLTPYKWSRVVYKGKEIDQPWLCMKCFAIEKRKFARQMESASNEARRDEP